MDGRMASETDIFKSGMRRLASGVSIVTVVMVWKMTLMSVGHPLSCRTKLVAPYEWLSRKPAPRCELPFSFGWQALPRE